MDLKKITLAECVIDTFVVTGLHVIIKIAKTNILCLTD